MEGGRSVFKIISGKPTGKRPLGRSGRRWEDDIRKDLIEIGINTRNWVDSAQNRDNWRAQRGIEPLGSVRHGIS